ncbi:hypothetical protein [Fodinicola acaciae]|uniref:hypothetical protein n=1 Tax=Fodinicola acaciae TaxID=2681555 RepID=UPI0013CFB41F|nr:hypothetical protein [Fodinicola acaciae]
MKASDYQELREEIVRTVELPDLDEIHRRGRRRQIATNPTWAIGAVAIVMAAVFVAVSVTSRPAPPPGIADRPDLGTPVHLALQGERIPADGPFGVLNSITIDKWTTYALARSSAGIALVRTFDGGTTWQAWTLPKELAAQKLVGFDSAGPGQAVSLIVNRGGVSYKGGKDILYVSLDGGQSWSKEPALGAPVDAFPAGWPLDVRQRQVVAIDPSNGVPHPLVKKWSADYPYLGESRVMQAKDGSLWRATGFAYVEKLDLRVEVSRDRGRTWSAAKVPSAPAGYEQAYATVASYDGRTAYALVNEMELHQKGFPASVGALYVSHDGGATWSLVSRGAVTAGSGLAVLPNGTLLASKVESGAGPDAGQWLMASRDGGRSFQEASGVGGGPGTIWVRFMRSATGGYVVLTLTGRGGEPTVNRWYVTTDGMTWTPAPEPPRSSTTPWDVNASPNR